MTINLRLPIDKWCRGIYPAGLETSSANRISLGVRGLPARRERTGQGTAEVPWPVCGPRLLRRAVAGGGAGRACGLAGAAVAVEHPDHRQVGGVNCSVGVQVQPARVAPLTGAAGETFGEPQYVAVVDLSILGHVRWPSVHVPRRASPERVGSQGGLDLIPEPGPSGGIAPAEGIAIAVRRRDGGCRRRCGCASRRGGGRWRRCGCRCASRRDSGRRRRCGCRRRAAVRGLLPVSLLPRI